MGENRRVSTISKMLSIVAFVLLLAACEVEIPTRLTPGPTAVVTPPYPGIPLGIGNANRITELADFQVDGSGPVIALAFTQDGQQIVAVYGGDGMLRRWKISDGSLQAVWDVSPVEMSLVSFDDSTRLMVTRSENGNGARLWDTETGESLLDLTASYEGWISALALSPDGRWVFGGWPGADTYWDTKTGHSPQGGSYAIEVDGELGAPAIPTIATFDPGGEWAVVGYEHGMIEAHAWDGDLGLFELGTFAWAYSQSKDSPLQVPLALALDPTRRWLAAIVGDSLQTWDTSVYPLPCRRVHGGVGTGQSASLAFSPDGKLLAVGTGEGWQIWSVPKFSRIMKQPGRATYAVTFSPDGRLISSGDESGVIHVWGVKK